MSMLLKGRNGALFLKPDKEILDLRSKRKHDSLLSWCQSLSSAGDLELFFG